MIGKRVAGFIGFLATWALPAGKVLSAVIGLGGLPDDLAAWQSLLSVAVGGFTVLDWIALAVGLLCLLYAVGVLPKALTLDGTTSRDAPASGKENGEHGDGLNRVYPPTIKQTPRRNLTNVDGERLAEMFRDVHDFMGGDVEPYRIDLIKTVCGRLPMLGALEALQPRQQNLAANAGLLWQKHMHYLDLVGLDFRPLYERIEALRTPIADCIEAKGWPTEAQKAPSSKLNSAFSELGTTITQMRNLMEEKRRDFLDE